MLNYKFDELTPKKITPEILKNFNLMVGAANLGQQDESFINYHLADLRFLSCDGLKKIEKLLGLIKDSSLKQRLSTKHFEFLLIEMDKCFFENWDQFQLKMSEFSAQKKSISNFKKKQNYIQECSLMAFLKEVKGLLNRIDIELFGAQLLSLHIEQTQKHLTLIDSWVQIVEDADLIHNEIHASLLRISLKINILTSESHLKLALHYWLRKKNTDLSDFHFGKGAELILLCEQSMSTLKKIYKYSRMEYSIACFGFWVWTSAYNAQFIQGRYYIKKLIDCLNQSSVIISHFVEPIIVYAENLSLSENRDLQEVISYLDQALNLLTCKEVYTEDIPTSQYQAFIEQTRLFCEHMKQTYENEIIFLLKQYDFFKTYQDDVLLLEISPRVNVQRIAEYFNKLPGVIVCKNKNDIEISKISLIPTNTLKNILSEIDQLLQSTLEKKIFEKTMIEKEKKLLDISINSEESLSYEENMCPSLIDSSELDQKNRSFHQNNSELLIKKEITLSLTDIDTSSKETINDLTANFPCKLSLSERNKALSYGFTNELFEDICIHRLEGAKGIFVAYNPERKLSQKCKIDSQVQTRFKNLLDCPYKVSPKNKNGFKWVAHGDSATLIGKIARMPYRLFPEGKQINDKGETAYFFGFIKNTKRGKKSNQY